MATVRLMTSLLGDIPPVNVTVGERAAWFDRKADAFERIAAESGPLAAEAAQLAEGARAEAERIRDETCAGEVEP